MMAEFEGRAFIFGDDIDTDALAPGRYMSAPLAKLAAGANPDTAPKLLAGTGSDQTHLLIVMTSERGLCGGFNANIINHVLNALTEEFAGRTVEVT